MMIINKRFQTLLIIFLLVGLVGSITWTSPVKAQSSTILAITPSSSTALTCSETIVTVRAQDVVGLYGYDLSLTFNPAAIEILEVTNSGWLDSGYTLINNIDNVSGTINFAMTQVSPSVPKTGSGDLISIRLRAKSAGLSSNLTIVKTGDFPSILSTSLGVSIPFTASNGTITTDSCPPADLSIYPQSSIACGTSNTIVKVRVANVEDLYSYTLSLSFTPGDIQILSVTNGGFLSSGFYEPSNGFNNSTGTISFGMTQLSPALPKTGSGDLISITLRAVVPNATVNLVINEASSTLVNWPEVVRLPFNATDGVIYTRASCDPTAVDLLSFTAAGGVKSITLNWKTASETNNLGFNLYRANALDGKRVRLNAALIPSLAIGSPFGADYEYTDAELKPGKTYFYWLEDVDSDGYSTLHDPASATVQEEIKPAPKPTRETPPGKQK